MADLLKDFATATHPTYDDRLAEWTKAEKVYRGGTEVRELLQLFYWEEHRSDEGDGATDLGTTHYDARKDSATFPEFTKRMVERFVGALSSEAPNPEDGDLDISSLGNIRPKSELSAPLTKAELLYYDVDRKGATLPTFMNTAQKWSMVMGHVWCGVEAPQDTGVVRTEADEQNGFHPYLVRYLPSAVPNWIYEDGRLVALVINISSRTVVKDGGYDGTVDTLKLVYIAGNYTEITEDFGAVGGWILLDSEGEFVYEEGQTVQGTLEKTGGEIPYVPLFYTDDDDAFSIAGTTEIASVDISYMNLASAGDNDAIEGGGRMLLVLGTDTTSFNKAAKVKREGGRMIPIEPSVIGGSTITPSIYDSASVSASSAIEAALKRKKDEASTIAADELTRGPNTSGEARKVEFLDVKLPRLSIMAGHREAAEQSLINFAEQRWGIASPTGKVSWKRDFDYETDVEDWESVLEAAFKMDVNSPTLNAKALKGIIDSKRLAIDPADWTQIEAEIVESAAQKEQEEADLKQTGEEEEEENV